MFKFIFFLLLHAFFTLANFYANEEIKLWYSRDDVFFVKSPRLDDLKDTEYVCDMQLYVERVIAPAERYFTIEEEIEKYQKDEDMQVIAYPLLFLAMSLLCANEFYKINIVHTFWICGLISFISLLLITLIVYFSYRQYSKSHPKRFRYSIEELKKSFACEYFEGIYEFNISKDCALNNYVIKKHNEYLQSIKSNVFFRRNIRKILAFVTIMSFVIAIASIPK